MPTLAAPATAPAARPPLDALVLYARARDAMQQGRRHTALALLDGAISLDPYSFELHYALGKAHLTGVSHDPLAVAAMERAAELRPDHLDVHLDLARQYLARGDEALALRHLRLAMQTSDYAGGADRAAEADLFLGHTLQAMGYLRAAIEQYERLLARLAESSARGPATTVATGLRDKIHMQIGDLRVRLGEPQAALADYGKAAAVADAGSMELDARMARALLMLGRGDDALRRSTAAVVRTSASPESIALLRDVLGATGRSGDAAAELRKLYIRNPEHRALGHALADLLAAEGRHREADRVLLRIFEGSPTDADSARRRYHLAESSGDVQQGLDVLIFTLTLNPTLDGELQELWPRLAWMARTRGVSIETLVRLSAPAQEPARQYALAQLARQWPRSTLAREATKRLRSAQGGADSATAPLLRAPPESPSLQAYQAHRAAGEAQKAAADLAEWKAADPLAITPRLLEARDHIDARRFDKAAALLDGVFAEVGDEPRVLAEMHRLHSTAGTLEQWAAKLEQHRTVHSRAFRSAMALVRIQRSLGRNADALLDATRETARLAGEPDVIYELAGLYDEVGRHDAAEEALLEALSLDPKLVGANNGLARRWAEALRNLPRAELLARAAVDADPGNAALLDTLGQVLYKQGRFEEARQVLERANGPKPTNDKEPRTKDDE